VIYLRLTAKPAREDLLRPGADFAVLGGGSRMTFMSFRFFASILFLVGFSAVEAQAETRTPYRARISKNCPGEELCSVPTGVVAANRRIELENVSCVAQLTPLSSAGTKLVGAYIYTNPAPNVYHYLTNNWNRAGVYTFRSRPASSPLPAKGSSRRSTVMTKRLAPLSFARSMVTWSRSPETERSNPNQPPP
jgi:hypothetical protein